MDNAIDDVGDIASEIAEEETEDVADEFVENGSDVESVDDYTDLNSSASEAEV